MGSGRGNCLCLLDDRQVLGSWVWACSSGARKKLSKWDGPKGMGAEPARRRAAGSRVSMEPEGD